MMFGITGLTPSQPGQSKIARLLLSFTVLITLLACDKPEPVEPYTAPANELVTLFDQFDSTYSGVAYWDFKRSRENESFDTIQRQILPFLQSSEFTGKFSDGIVYLDSVGINIAEDLDYAAVAIYSKPDSGYRSALVLEGRIPVQKWKGMLKEFGDKNEQTDFEWYKTQSGNYWVSFPKNGRAIITTDRSLIKWTAGNGDRLISELARECAAIPQQAEAFFYFNDISKQARWDFGEEGTAHAVFEGKDVRRLFAGMYFREKLVIRGQADLTSSSGVSTSTFFINAALNFVSMKAFFSNETVLTDFVKVESQDSSIVIKADVPVSALADVNKIGIEK